MKQMKRILAAALALTMLLSLAACDKDKGEQPTVTPDAHAGEMVYASQYRTLREGGSGGLSPLLFTEEGFYARSSEKVGEEIPEGVVPQYEGQYDVYETRYYFVSYDGQIDRLDKYTPAVRMENTEGYADFSSNSSLYALQQTEDGKLLGLEQVYSSWYSGPEGLDRSDDEYWSHYVSQSVYYLRFLNEDGSEISSTLMEGWGENTYFNGNNAVLDSQGNFVMGYGTYEGEWGVIAMAPDGSIAYQIAADDYIDSVIKLSDGRIAVSTWGRTGQELKAVDVETGKFGESCTIPSQAYNLIPGSGDYDFYYTSGVNLYGYKLGAEDGEKLLNWISCDVNSNDLYQFSMLRDGSIVGVINDWSSTDRTVTTELVQLNKVPYESVPQKETLTLAVQYTDYNLRNMVIDFNRSHDDIRVDIIDYSEYNNEDDWSAGLTKLTTEILAGNLPDLLYLDELPYMQLASKGLLEDLYPYLDADAELDRADFFENILAAMEVNGGLYQVTPSFSIITAMGAKSIVGEEPGWTYEELYAALEKLPEGAEIFGRGMTKEEVLLICLYMNMDSLIDWSSGKCFFDGQDFLDMLHFTDRFPLEFDYSNYDSAVDSDRVRVSQGRQLLMTASIYSFSDLGYNEAYFGGPGKGVYIGFPTSDGSAGSALFLTEGLAMSAKCRNKEAAWEFLRIFLTEEYQRDNYALPSNRAEFERQLQEEATPRYKTDAQGNYLLDENGEKIEESRGGMAEVSENGGSGWSYELYALTQEQVDALMDLVENTTNVIQMNDTIFDLIQEDAAAFFNGQKSAEEVAKLIQSKVNIYVNEQR